MKTASQSLIVGLILGLLIAGTVWAVPNPGAELPEMKAVDIREREFNTATLETDLIVLFFFAPGAGEDVAVRLNALARSYGPERVAVAAIGLKQDSKALAEFADRYKLKYFIIEDTPDNEISKKLSPLLQPPFTIICAPQQKVLKLVEGGGETSALVLSEVAEVFLMQGDADDARKTAEAAAIEGEDARLAGEILGYAYVAEGKLEEAKDQFGKISSSEGLARVALEEGNPDEAYKLASAAGDSGYADTIRALSLLQAGKTEEAAPLLLAALEKPARLWQQSEAINGQGRLLHAQGKTNEALAEYEKAQAVDPFNTAAMTNASAALRENGDLQQALEVLQKAEEQGRPDSLATLMLEQARRMLDAQNDVQRHEAMRKQIDELASRMKEQKASGETLTGDDWTSRPLVVAFLPTENRSPVFFERAGADIAIQRGIETQLAANRRFSVVEREMLDTLLQELNLGSSELADSNTQLQLGKVLSAQLLGFMDFAQNGANKTLYVRMVNSETSDVATQVVAPVDPHDPSVTINVAVQELAAKVVADRALQGLIAEVSSESEVLINLGARHGLEPGVQFAALKDGGTVEVGGKTLKRDPVAVATLEVVSVEDEVAIAKVVDKQAGIVIESGMKIRERGKDA